MINAPQGNIYTGYDFSAQLPHKTQHTFYDSAGRPVFSQLNAEGFCTAIAGTGSTCDIDHDDRRNVRPAVWVVLHLPSPHAVDARAFVRRIADQMPTFTPHLVASGVVRSDHLGGWWDAQVDHEFPSEKPEGCGEMKIIITSGTPSAVAEQLLRMIAALL
jgi:hypothetical protein